jgi:predicted amidohydrolase
MDALLAQLGPQGSTAAATGRATKLIGSSDEFDLVVFPELFLSDYDLAVVATRAMTLDAAPIAELRKAAAASSTAVAVGFAERRGSAVFNSLALIDEGGDLVDVYRKIYLFGDEQSVFAAGDDLILAELAGRVVGPQICFDVEFPEPSRALAKAGADLLLTVAANPVPFYSDHLIATQARALDNRLPHLYVNRCGLEAGLEFVGGTRAIRPDGTISALVSGGGERELAVGVDSPGTDDDRVDYLAHLREDLNVKNPYTTGGTR